MNKKKNTGWIRFAAAMMAGALLAQPAYAIQVSSQYGRIQSQVRGTNGKTIVLIEEAHVDYGAQQSIAGLLKGLIQKNGYELICLEGGWGNNSLSYLRHYGSVENRNKTADQYLKEGKISGEEYLDITSDLPMVLWGAEDSALYADNMKAFLELQVNEARDRETLRNLKKIFALLQDKILAPEISEFLKKREAFHSERLSLPDYIRILSLSAGAETLEAYPAIKKFSELVLGHSGVNIEKAQLEKRELTNLLAKMLTKPELQDLDIYQERQDAESELASIKNLIRAYQKHPELKTRVSIRNLKSYGKMLLESLILDGGRVFDELEQLEEVLMKRFPRAEAEKEYLTLLSAFEILEKLFGLNLTPSEFQRFSGAETAMDLSRWQEILGARLNQYQLTGVSVPALAALNADRAAAKAFYSSAIKREKALIQNTVSKMDDMKIRKAVMIVGGFHTRSLAKSLRREGFSVIQMTPKFKVEDSESQHRHYLNVLKYKWERALVPGRGLMPKPVQKTAALQTIQK